MIGVGTDAPRRETVGSAALSALFGIVTAVAFDSITIPLTLYVPLSGPARHVNIPQVAVVPLLAGIVLSVLASLLDGDRVDARVLARGLVLGTLATLYAGLMGAVLLLLGDPYFTSPYRLYALLFLGAASLLATWWLWRIARGRLRIASGRLLSWPLLAVIAAVALLAIARREPTPGGAALLGALVGAAAAERGFRPGVSVDRKRVLLAILVLTFAFRAIFGLQVLARTGGGPQFATASDDGPSYYDKAVALYAHPGTASWDVLAANDGFPPAYSFFVGGIFAVTRGSLAAVVLAQAVAAVAIALLLYALASRVGGPVVGLLAAGLFATDQNLIQDGSTLTPESILMPVALLAFWAADRHLRSGRSRWLLLAAAAVGLAFITRNIVGGAIAFSLAAWLVVLRRAWPLHAIRDAALIVGAVLLFSMPVFVATSRVGPARLTNQLAGAAFALEGNEGTTVENTFLLQRGIDPFKSLPESVGHFVADPLPVIGFFVRAVPQRAMTLMFFAPSGAADPVAIVVPTQYPNLYGQLLKLVLLLALIATAIRLIRRPPWRVAALPGLLLIYAVVYVGLFTFLFPPDHPFRYRIPVEPIMWIAEALGLVVLLRAAALLWSPSDAAR